MVGLGLRLIGCSREGDEVTVFALALGLDIAPETALLSPHAVSTAALISTITILTRFMA
jgi:hypothetical protein